MFVENIDINFNLNNFCGINHWVLGSGSKSVNRFFGRGSCFDRLTDFNRLTGFEVPVKGFNRLTG